MRSYSVFSFFVLVLLMRITKQQQLEITQKIRVFQRVIKVEVYDSDQFGMFIKTNDNKIVILNSDYTSKVNGLESRDAFLYKMGLFKLANKVTKEGDPAHYTSDNHNYNYSTIIQQEKVKRNMTVEEENRLIITTKLRLYKFYENEKTLFNTAYFFDYETTSLNIKRIEEFCERLLKKKVALAKYCIIQFRSVNRAKEVVTDRYAVTWKEPELKRIYSMLDAEVEQKILSLETKLNYIARLIRENNWELSMIERQVRYTLSLFAIGYLDSGVFNHIQQQEQETSLNYIPLYSKNKYQWKIGLLLSFILLFLIAKEIHSLYKKRVFDSVTTTNNI